MSHPDVGYQKLATALLADAVKTLRQEPPPPEPETPPAEAEGRWKKSKNAKGGRRWQTREEWEEELRGRWVRAWERWEADRMRDRGFVLDGRRSLPWCEMAGIDRDVVVEELHKRELLYDARERFPVTADGECAVYPT